MHPADEQEMEKLHKRHHEDIIEREKQRKIIIEQAELIRRLTDGLLDISADAKALSEDL